MAKNRITWQEFSAEEDGYYVYRDTAAIDPLNLPAPLAEVPMGVGMYDDDTAVDGTTYYYYVAPFADDEVGPGVEAQVIADESLPRFVNCSRVTGSASNPSITATIPECKAGDILVAFGMRRGVLAPLAGWTDAGAPPDPPSGAFEQWTYTYWKVADGSESNTELTVEYDDGSSNRITLSVAVFRHDTKPINVSTLDLQRAPTSASASNPLEVTNGPQEALLFCAFGWVYASTGAGDETWVDNWSAGYPPFYYQLYIDIDIPYDSGSGGGQLRYFAFMYEAEADEAVSITYDTDATNSDDSRSSIWLALTV